ncbi:hypothetical protein CDAR_544641 [Caerostris darwini]|uniref:Uncharacterized protein n=1 Tax=Caerostris darwini TaxID=1538125 RepID=A0AAV4UJ70_9ARAC|nr:hypothetical protein CDAR_544641 [Caerostris darwini]
MAFGKYGMDMAFDIDGMDTAFDIDGMDMALENMAWIRHLENMDMAFCIGAWIWHWKTWRGYGIGEHSMDIAFGKHCCSIMGCGW